MTSRFFLAKAIGPVTHADRAMCLIGLGDDALLSQVEHAAVTHDAAWLRTMLDLGVFSFSLELIHTAKSGASLEALDKLSRLLDASRIEDAMVPGPEAGFPLTSRRLALEASAKFQQFFGDLVDHAIEQEKIFSRHWKCEDDNALPWSVDNHLAMTFSGLLSCACALDRPDLAEKLLSHRPALVDKKVDSPSMRGVLDRYHGLEPFDPATRLLPAFFALQFGSQRCLDVLREVRGRPLLYAYTNRSECNSGLATDTDNDQLPHPTFGVLESFDILVPLCDPEVVRATIEAECYLRRPKPRAKMLTLVMASLKPFSSSTRMDVFAPVFEAVGGFAIDPTTTLVCALEGGWATYTRAHYGVVDWSAVFEPEAHEPTESRRAYGAPVQSSLATSTVQSTLHRSDDWIDRCDKALAGAIDHAVADGAMDAAKTVQANEADWDERGMGTMLPQPMASMVLQEFSRSLLALMRAGVDPNRPLVPDAWTLLQLADAKKPEVAHTMRTFANRGRALEVLEEM